MTEYFTILMSLNTVLLFISNHNTKQSPAKESTEVQAVAPGDDADEIQELSQIRDIVTVDESNRALEMPEWWRQMPGELAAMSETSSKKLLSAVTFLAELELLARAPELPGAWSHGSGRSGLNNVALPVDLSSSEDSLPESDRSDRSGRGRATLRSHIKCVS